MMKVNSTILLGAVVLGLGAFGAGRVLMNRQPDDQRVFAVSERHDNEIKGDSMTDKVVKSDQEWQQLLTTEQYYVMRQKGTEQPFTGKYVDFHEDGVFTCAACGQQLFDSKTKYESGSGWPSFYAPVGNDQIKLRTDSSFGMLRTEVACPRCGAHLGHLFGDGPPTTGMRYCINSVALNFVGREQKSTSTKTDTTAKKHD